MLKQASVRQLRNREIPRENSKIVVAMCYFPRGLRKDLFDDYRNQLAPDRALFREWKVAAEKVGHDKAFETAQYERRFTLSPTALLQLKIYCEQKEDIFFVCQCNVGERCHREMLMLIGEKKYGAQSAPRFYDYPVLAARIPEMDDTFRW